MIRKFLINYSVLLCFLILQACNFNKEELVNSSRSEYYYFSSSRNSIIYKYKQSLFGIPLGSKKQTMEADVETFTVLDKFHAKDKNNVFYMHIELEADPNSYLIINNIYSKDKNNIYYKEIKLTNVDVASFEHDGKSHITRDKKYVFVDRLIDKQNGILGIIEEANPKSYVWIKQYWGKDDNNYFFNDQKAEVDVSTFNFITDEVACDKDNIYYFRGATLNSKHEYSGDIKQINENVFYDNNQIYNFKYMPSSVISCNDISTLVIFDSVNTIFSVDNKFYWKTKEKNSAIDVNSFRFINKDYAKDTNNVYYNGIVIEGADIATFKVLKKSFSKDKNHVFYMSSILPKADPRTFRYVKMKGKDYLEDKNYKWEYSYKEYTWVIVNK